MREHEAEFWDMGVNVAAIGLGGREYARQFREETGIPFRLLIDEDRLAYRAAGLRSANILHLTRKENAVARSRARAAGHKQHKLGQNPFQLGGTFIFGPGDVDIHAHISSTFGDNESIGKILEVLRRR